MVGNHLRKIHSFSFLRSLFLRTLLKTETFGFSLKHTEKANYTRQSSLLCANLTAWTDWSKGVRQTLLSSLQAFGVATENYLNKLHFLINSREQEMN